MNRVRDSSAADLEAVLANLASGESKFVTGAELVRDGGHTAQ